MVKIGVDEAEAFDRLAILLVKTAQTGQKQRELRALAGDIRDSVGKELYEKIMNSEETDELVRVNSRVYQLIDATRSGKRILAKTVDGANLERFVIKKRFQKKFFGTELRERKYGIEAVI